MNYERKFYLNKSEKREQKLWVFWEIGDFSLNLILAEIEVSADQLFDLFILPTTM